MYSFSLSSFPPYWLLIFITDVLLRLLRLCIYTQLSQWVFVRSSVSLLDMFLASFLVFVILCMCAKSCCASCIAFLVPLPFDLSSALCFCTIALFDWYPVSWIWSVIKTLIYKLLDLWLLSGSKFLLPFDCQLQWLTINIWRLFTGMLISQVQVWILQ